MIRYRNELAGMALSLSDMQALDLWRRAVLAGVRRDAPDLSARQMAVLLTVYLTPPPHTVRGLAAELNVSKPAITRALDRLGQFEMVRRRIDDQDRRNVLVQRTVKGSVFLREWGGIISGVAAAIDG
jgi:DNA-binding MarR family transcriptional regulator